MSKKPETTFIASVHKHFPDKQVPHREKMNNPYRSGTADVWYSGRKGDLWVEYKFIPKLPVKSNSVLVDCSPLQLKWLGDRHREGRSVFVIVGHPAGGVILSDLEWGEPMSVTEFERRTVSREAICKWLVLNLQG